MRQLAAIRALRMNYRWSGVRVWLRVRHWYRWNGTYAYWQATSKDHAIWRPYGWWLVLRYPSLVVADQFRLAEGVFT